MFRISVVLAGAFVAVALTSPLFLNPISSTAYVLILRLSKAPLFIRGRGVRRAPPCNILDPFASLLAPVKPVVVAAAVPTAAPTILKGTSLRLKRDPLVPSTPTTKTMLVVVVLAVAA
jgi:hypothetical protein